MDGWSTSGTCTVIIQATKTCHRERHIKDKEEEDKGDNGEMFTMSEWIDEVQLWIKTKM